MKNILWNVFEILVNVYQSFIITHFTYKFLTPKPLKNKISALCVTSVIIALLITLMNHITIFEGIETLVYWLVLFIYILTCLNGNAVKKIFASVLPWALVFSVTMVDLNFMASLNDMTIEEIVSRPSLARATVLISIQAIIYFLLKIILKNFSTDSLTFHLSEWTAVISVMIVSFVTAAFLHMIAIGELDAKQRDLLNLSLLALLFINIFVFHMINSLLKKNKQLQQMEILQLQQRYGQQYIDNANQQYDSIRKIRHDIKNQLSAVRTLLSNGEYDRAMQLIEKSGDSLVESFCFVRTNDPVANAIINSKLSVASAMGIRTSCVTVDEFDGIDPIDLCNLLSNALDNAITACSEISADKKRSISLVIKNENGFYVFTLKNSITGSVLSENPDLHTSKGDRTGHGYGTRILREIAGKYSGSCHFFEDDDQFCCCIRLKHM